MLVDIEDQAMRELIEGVGGESRKLEYKESFEWHNSDSSIEWIQAKTIKTILALANNESGGSIVIGVKEKPNSAFDFVGMKEEHVSSFDDTESIKTKIDDLSTGHVDFDIRLGKVEDKKFIVITVKEFRLMPIFAARDLPVKGELVIKKDDIYVRSNTAKPQTKKITVDEFRDLVTLVETKDESYIKRFSPYVGGKIESDDKRYEELDKDL